MNYFLHIGTLFCIHLMMVQSMNLYLGYTGILSLGHVAFYGIGAYTSAILTLNGVPFIWAFLASALLCALLGFFLGLSSIRLRADYLGIATLGFSQVVLSVMQNWNSLTNGTLGLSKIPRPSLFGFMADEKWELFLLAFVVVSLLTFILYRLVKSPFGQTLETIRDDEVAAMSIGKNTVAYKLAAFSLGAGIAGLAGSLFAHFITYISPHSFVIEELSFVLVMTVIGGLGTFRGPFLGTLVIYVLYESMRFLDLPADVLGPLRLLMYSGLFILTLLYFPQGVGGFWKTRKRRAKQFTTY